MRTSARSGRSTPTANWVERLGITFTRSPKPLRLTISAAVSAIDSTCSQVLTRRAPARAAIIASKPEPVPISST
jgi:hypothetical protein